jgi:hypothetical protein
MAPGCRPTRGPFVHASHEAAGEHVEFGVHFTRGRSGAAEEGTRQQVRRRARLLALFVLAESRGPILPARFCAAPNPGARRSCRH